MPACMSKYNHKHDNQVNLLMITDNENNWHYLAIKNISRLLGEINQTIMGTFIAQTAFIHTQQRKNLKSMKRYAKTVISVM